MTSISGACAANALSRRSRLKSRRRSRTPDSDLVHKIRPHLNDYLAKRPHTIRIDTTGLREDATYQLLLSTLNAL